MKENGKSLYELACEVHERAGEAIPSEQEWLESMRGSTNPATVYDRHVEEMTLGGEDALSKDDYLEYLKVVAQETGLPHPIKNVRSYIQDFPVEFLKKLVLYRRRGEFKLLANMFKVTVQQMGVIVKDLYGYTIKELESFNHFSALTRQPICGEWNVVCMHGWVYDELGKLNLPISRAASVFAIKDSTYLHLIDLSDIDPVGYAVKLSGISWGDEIRMAAHVVPESLVFSALGVVETYTTRA